MLHYIGFQNVCVCLCHGLLVVNALVIVNVWAFLVFCSFRDTVNVLNVWFFLWVFLFSSEQIC